MCNTAAVVHGISSPFAGPLLLSNLNAKGMLLTPDVGLKKSNPAGVLLFFLSEKCENVGGKGPGLCFMTLT